MDVWLVMKGTDDSSYEVVDVIGDMEMAKVEADRLQRNRTPDQAAWDFFVSGPWPVKKGTRWTR